MRILIISDAWHPQINGVVRTLEATAQQLKRMGHVVSIIGPDLGNWRTFAAPSYPSIKLEFFARNRLRREMEYFKPDTIHIATEGPLGWAMRNLCLKTQRAFSTSYHTRFPQYLAARMFPFLRKPVEILAYATLRHFHAPSSAVMVATASIERELQQHNFRRIVRWSRGVDTNLFKPFFDIGREDSESNTDDAAGAPLPLAGGDGGGPKVNAFTEASELERSRREANAPPTPNPSREREGNTTGLPYSDLPRPILLSVGRVAIEKNLEAFLVAKNEGTKVVIGDGPDLEMLKSKYPAAHFLGAMEGEELARHYAAADLFVFPSMTDTFGLVLLEAVASGLRIASTPAPGPADIFSDLSTRKFVALDINLESAIRQALVLPHDPTLPRRFAESYSWEACTRQFVEHLQAPPPEVIKRICK